MEVLFRDSHIEKIHRTTRLPKSTIKTVIVAYTDYLSGLLARGETVKFLNICYISFESGGRDAVYFPTLAYISHEIGKGLYVGKESVFSILTAYEEGIVSGLRRHYKYSIRRLVSIRVDNTPNGLRVRVKKSSCYNGMPVRVHTLGLFKRRVEQ